MTPSLITDQMHVLMILLCEKYYVESVDICQCIVLAPFVLLCVENLYIFVRYLLQVALTCSISSQSAQYTSFLSKNALAQRVQGLC